MVHQSNRSHTPPPKSAREYDYDIARLTAIIDVAATEAGRIADDTQDPAVADLEAFLKDEHPNILDFAGVERPSCNGSGQVSIPYGQRTCRGCVSCGGGA